MTINPEIKKIIRDHNIDYASSILVLFSIYHDFKLTGDIHDVLKDTMTQINVIKIVERNIDSGAIVWNIPLYENELKESVWQWVLNEYRPLFRNVNKDRGGSPSSCIKRMQIFFSKHPEVRKEDVIEAAKLYIQGVNNPNYLQAADYFISKGKGAEVTSRLEQFIEMVMEGKKSTAKPKMMGQ